ncbi:hypothetical protein [Halomonas halocynthiae]|uniref:hypothetical protein n=1 Tax=Halomonas halocynthiae TaxID=176290 RepID=UPI000685D2A0|nr:hypothetical protein [Halomonas halocynthiae]
MRSMKLFSQRALQHTMLCLTSLALTSQVQATNFNIGDIESHGRWKSLVLSLGDEHYARALDDSSYADSILSINARPGHCQQPWVELRVRLQENQAQSEIQNHVAADIRVDEQPIHSGSVAFITNRGDDGFYARFNLEEMTLLLNEMTTGEIMRVRMMRSENDPWFMAFGLEGAKQAIERMNQLCESPSL